MSLPASSQLANRFRLMVVGGVLLVGGLGLGLNLFKLQIIQGQELGERAQQQQKVAPPAPIPRRPITDRNGNLLAIDRPVYTLYAHPQMFKKPAAQIADQLGRILDRPAGELEGLFKSGDTGIRVADFLAQEVGDRIATESIDGLELIQNFTRLYPQQDVAAEIVGYIDVDKQAQAGVEYSQQNLLERSVPEEDLEETSDEEKTPQATDSLQPVDDLHLQVTIDTRLQRAVRSALKQQMEQYRAPRGTVMVMDARDGSLLSLVSEPSYDPNKYYNFDLARFKNWALTDIYEPGSTFKPITVAIALEAGAVQPNSVFNDEGLVYVDEWPIANADYEYAGGRGSLTLTEIVQYSSNVGMVHVAAQMQPEVFYSWLERLGLGQPVGIDLPFAVPSQIKSQVEFTASPVNSATTAFGQGFALTPLQLLQLHGTLANGGKLVTPHVVRGLYNTAGEAFWQPELPLPRQVFSSKTTKTVLAMMEEAVVDGTGKAAQISGYRIAGKTGTAQKSDGYGYSDYAKVVSFVGIFPAEAPRYVVLAVVDEPDGGSGGAVAAPIVKLVIDALIAIEGIPPSQVERTQN
ncbi:penicillin-binding protein 2 [Microcoleus sp. FACHB-672]|nr:penicillin-binding protein 2 [Microcoleus sp. FACHB-672]